jgi:hypothetical protein
MCRLSYLLFPILVLSYCQGRAQKFNPSIDKDSLFNALIKYVHSDKKEDFSKAYMEGDDKSKEFLLYMLYMPKSSKAEMITNFEKKKEQILLLRDEYPKLVPQNYRIYVEFNPADKVFQVPASIDLHIYGKSEEKEPGGWNLEYGSQNLKTALEYIGWDERTLQKIEKMLNNAGCVSIQNGTTCEIGFARSGMGKYSYLVFNDKLTKDELEEHNDGCNYIYYKDNIVLEYGGGAVGPQCFPD